MIDWLVISGLREKRIYWTVLESKKKKEFQEQNFLMIFYANMYPYSYVLY